MRFLACRLLHAFWHNKTDKEILPESRTASGRTFIASQEINTTFKQHICDMQFNVVAVALKS
jgi:hypothetical protein